MKIASYLFTEFFRENMSETILLISCSLGANILHTTFITHFNSAVITTVQERAFDKSVIFFKYFMYARIFLALFNLFYRWIQDILLSKTKQWLRLNLIDLIFRVNNENMSNVNFTKLNTPINRLSETCFAIISDTLSYSLPYFMFSLASIFYFMYQNWEIGTVFLLGNVALAALMLYIWPVMRTRSNNFENSSLQLEKHLTESLNNIDKILTRGQRAGETHLFQKEGNETMEAHRDYYNSISVSKFMIELISLMTMFICVGYSIHLFMEDKINAIQFVSLFTLLMVFKERMNAVASLVSDSIEQYGRLEAVLEPFQEFDDKVDNVKKRYQPKELAFNEIVLDKVWFRYNKDLDYIFEDKSLIFESKDNKIVGITGESGKGKSTFTKLLLKLYRTEKGTITIDDVDIEDIDPDYLRQNITYINQNSKLFDKTVLENILYGCQDEAQCREHYKTILQYPKIRNLYENVDLNNDEVGFSGENLSGGQRQIVNIISGLINPSKILILDEPTNALDPDLKKELLQIIKQFKDQKQCILIITHDKEVENIFDEKLKL